MADVRPNEPPSATVAVKRLDVRATTLSIFVAAGTVYAVREGVSLLAPLLVSVLLAYALEPFVRLLNRCRLPRALAVVTVYALLVAGGVVAGSVAKRQIVTFVDALPATVRDFQTSMRRQVGETPPTPRPSTIQHLQNAAAEITATIGSSASQAGQSVTRVTTVDAPFNLRTSLADASIAIGATTMRLGAIGLLTLFLLLGGESLKRKLIAIAGPRAQKKVTHDVIKAIDRQIERYLAARVLISAMVAGATWLGLWWLGVREPLALGLIAGVLNVMPFVGPTAAVALVALVAFLQFQTIAMTAAASGIAGAVAALEGNLISPLLTSRAGELNTVAVFVSVLFWGWMWDVWGLVLAIPIMVAIKAAADHIEPLHSLGELLGR